MLESSVRELWLTWSGIPAVFILCATILCFPFVVFHAWILQLEIELDIASRNVLDSSSKRLVELERVHVEDGKLN